MVRRRSVNQLFSEFLHKMSANVFIFDLMNFYNIKREKTYSCEKFIVFCDKLNRKKFKMHELLYKNTNLVTHMPPLPGLTPKGCRVVMLRGVDKEMTTPNVSEMMKLTLMIGDIRLKEEHVGVAGDVYIMDANVATPAHFAKFTPALVKKFLICVQEAYPVKLKEVHVVNVSPIVDTIVNFVKPFLKEKIRERIFIHSSLDDLYKYVPKDMLPAEYGGNAGNIKDINDQWTKKLIDYTAWFKEQESSKSDESLRPGSPRTLDDLFGMDGTFRQLTID